MGWDALFDFLGAGGGLLILLQWLSGIPRRRLELKGIVKRRSASSWMMTWSR